MFMHQFKELKRRVSDRMRGALMTSTRDDLTKSERYWARQSRETYRISLLRTQRSSILSK